MIRPVEWSARIDPSIERGIVRQTPEAMLAALPRADALYSTSLLNQLHVEQTGGRQLLWIGENALPTTCVTPEEKEAKHGIISYTSIKDNPTFIEAAVRTHLVVHPLDAGLGTTVDRASWLAEIWPHTGRSGHPRLGAKGPDLYFSVRFPDGSIGLASVMELKYVRLMNEAESYAGVTIAPAINEESVSSIAEFFQGQTLAARIGGDSKSYEDSMVSLGISFGDPVFQYDLPNIDNSTGQLTADRVSPGSHGQVGFGILWEMSDGNIPHEPTVRTVYNGDGTNNFITKEMVGYLAGQRSGVLMISTPRTGADRKGGMFVLETIPEAKEPVLQILERAQAIEAGQVDMFYQVGLEGNGLPEHIANMHVSGSQEFNTNVFGLNESVLSPFLARLRAEIGDEALAAVMAPDLIKNQKGKYTQLEGAFASVVLKLNRFVQTNPKAKAIWNEVSGGARFLQVVDVSADDREIVFTPIKTTGDYWLQAFTDHFAVDVQTGMLVNNRPGHAVTLGAFVEDPYYKVVKNTVTALRGVSTIELDNLEIQGVVHAAYAIMRGTVRLENYSNAIVDLNEEPYRSQLRLEENGRLVLENVIVIIDQQGNLTVTDLAPSS